MGLSELLESGQTQRLAGGFQFTEGPVWHPEGHLLFSDIPGNRIIRWLPGGQVETFREPSGNANGLTLDRQGRLIACEHGNRRVSRTEADGTVAALADRYEGKRLNSPNDVVVRSDGSIYFTDPPYGIRPEQQELPFHGVYRLAPDGTLTLLADDFERPNGLAFSPDERILYIDDTARRHVRAFDVREDGSLARGRLFAELPSSEPGGPDGMKVDVEGNLYVTSAGGLWLFAASGRHAGTLPVPEPPPANCAFGGPDRRTLFITDRTSLLSVRTCIPGVPVL
jgi:sugar lactone lactonase YvrE